MKSSIVNRCRLAILGSCVTRDALSHVIDEIEILSYQARTCIPSMMAVPDHTVTWPEASQIPKFEKKNVMLDFRKSWMEELECGADAVILDFVDERFGVFEKEGSTFTFSTAFRQVFGEAAMQMVERYINPTSKEYEELVRRNLNEFCEKLSRFDKIILNNVYWAEIYEDGSPLPDKWKESIAAGNRVLNIIYEHVARRAKVSFVSVSPDLFVAKMQHRWGDAPFHYDDVTEKRMARAILNLAVS